MSSKLISSDVMDGVFFVAVGAGAFRLALDFHVPGSIALSPAIFPMIVSVVLAGLGLGLIHSSILRGKAAKSEPAEGIGSNYITVGIVFVLCFAYVAAMSHVGFVPATVAYLFLFLLLLGEKKKSLILLVPILTSAIVYLFFSKALSVVLP